MMRMIIVLAGLFVASAANADTCRIELIAKDGFHMGNVQTATGQPLSCNEALMWARVLNTRNNTGLNPVEATVVAN